MSRTGKKPIPAVSGVTVAINDRVVTAKGPKGEQSLTLMDIVNAKQTDQGIVIEPANDTQEARAAWGTTRALIANMVKGVKDGFEKKLQIQGVGFRAAMQGKDLKLSLGFSHEVVYMTPKGITHRGADRDRSHRLGRRQAAGRPGRGQYPRLSQAGALQGQGRAVCGRVHRPQRRQEEVRSASRCPSASRDRNGARRAFARPSRLAPMAVRV